MSLLLLLVLVSLATADPYERAYTLRSHTGYVSSLAFSPDDGGRYLASASGDATVKVWDVETDFDRNNASFTLRGHNDSVVGVAFSFDGHYLVSAGYDNVAQIWTMPDPENTPPIRLPIPCEPDHDTGVCYIDGLAYSPTEHVVAVYVVWSGVMLYSVPDAQLLYQWKDYNGVLAFSPDGRYVACGDRHDDLIYMLDAVNHNPEPVFVFRLPRYSSIYGLAFSPDGQHLAAGTAASTLSNIYTNIFDAGGFSTMDPIFQLKYHEYFVYSVGYSTDGAHLATGGGDGMVVVYQADAEYERVDVLYDDLTIAIYATVYSDDYLAVGASDRTIDIYRRVSRSPN